MVQITSIRTDDEYGMNVADFLIGSVYDKITTTIHFSVHWESLGIPVTIDAPNKTITRTDGLSWFAAGFSKGDTFTIVGLSGYYAYDDGNYTIDSLTSSVLTTVESIYASGVFTGVDFHGTTPID